MNAINQVKNRERKLIIVGVESGGVGKTTTVTFLAEIYRQAGVDFAILDADDKNRTAGGGSALSHALPHHDVVWLGAGPSLSEVEDNPDVVNMHWDKVREVLSHRNVILDLGANTVQRLIEYAVRMRAARRWAEDGISVECWVPMTSERTNLECAVKTLSEAGKAFGPAALRGVRNLRDGGFGAWDGTPQGDALKALAKKVSFVDLARAPIPLHGLEAMRREMVSPHQIVGLTRAEAAERLGLAEPVAERTLYGCEDWIEAVTAAWKGLVPAEAERVIH
jgi:hypothetical protein